jgi:mycothiol system anti-sigma-R factor
LSPIDCEQVLIQIELYLDGELESSLRVEMDRHLGACGPCGDRSDFKAHLRDLLKDKCGCREIPPQLLERVEAALRVTDPAPE